RASRSSRSFIRLWIARQTDGPAMCCLAHRCAASTSTLRSGHFRRTRRRRHRFAFLPAVQQRFWAGGCADWPGRTHSSMIARRSTFRAATARTPGELEMSIRLQYTYRQLTSDDATLLKELLRVFGHAFNDSETYQHAIPSDKYLTNLLGKDHFIVVVAMMEKTVVGGLAAYVLEKFEQQRREIYIYDLAVSDAHRHKGV